MVRVYSGTILPIFIEIGSHLTDKEQKISWHSFYETQYMMKNCQLAQLSHQFTFHLAASSTYGQHQKNDRRSIRRESLILEHVET